MILIIGSIIPILAGAMMLTGMEFESFFVAEHLQDVVATYYLVVGFIGLALAFGIWAGRRWAWILGIVVAVTGMLVGVYTLPPGVAAIVIDGIVLALLLLPSVRGYCG